MGAKYLIVTQKHCDGRELNYEYVIVQQVDFIFPELQNSQKLLP